jgi:hypothetical protein
MMSKPVLHRFTVEMLSGELSEEELNRLQNEECFYCTAPYGAEPEPYVAYWICPDCRPTVYPPPPNEHGSDCFMDGCFTITPPAATKH